MLGDALHGVVLQEQAPESSCENWERRLNNFWSGVDEDVHPCCNCEGITSSSFDQSALLRTITRALTYLFPNLACHAMKDLQPESDTLLSQLFDAIERRLEEIAENPR